jgi:hypothetical protein
MDTTISTLLGTIRLGEPSTSGALTLIPVFGETPGAPEFVTLGEALAAGSLVITEIDAGGSVPELMAHNQGPVGILVLDGEELMGAKQNRILNTSIFLEAGAKTVVPVSCTERGRWSHISARFEDSGNVAVPDVRRAAHRSVTANVRAGGSYRSDQGTVWNEVDKLQSRHAVASATDAMRDVYEQRAEQFSTLETDFPIQEGQIGIFALWGGEVVGFDVLAGAVAYAHVHGRLVRSYALDAPTRESKAGADDARTAKEWLVGLADTVATTHDSPGDGTSYRFTGPGVLGSALVVNDAVLHAVFFAAEPESAEAEQPRYPSARERRGRWEL